MDGWMDLKVSLYTNIDLNYDFTTASVQRVMGCTTFRPTYKLMLLNFVHVYTITILGKTSDSNNEDLNCTHTTLLCIVSGG